MSRTPETVPDAGIEGLVLALAKTYHWAGLYGADHPVLSRRMAEMHDALLARIPSEPGAQLLLGIARDKVLYRNQFVGEGQELIGRLTEALYLRQVATVGFDARVTPAGLLALLHHLHEVREENARRPPEEFVLEKGILGITLSPYNYRELLSRRLAEPDATRGTGGDREEELWRVLLTSDVETGDGEKKIVDEIAEFPDLLRAIMRRARAENARAAGGTPVPPEVLRRLLRRIGMLVRTLPADRKDTVLASLEAGIAADDGGPGDTENPYDLFLARSLAEGFSDDEFLDLLGTLVSVEGKGQARLRKIFETLAVDRDIRGSLLPRAGERVRESLQSRNYYDLKTWETVEKLLLSRSEDGYVEGDYARFLEDISGARGPYADRIRDAAPADAALLSAFRDEEMRRKSTTVLLELLAKEKRPGEFGDLLEEVRKTVPNVISRGDIVLLQTILLTLEALAGELPPDRQSAVRGLLQETDFGQVTDVCLAGAANDEEKDTALALLARFGAAATRPLLDRLLNEPEAARRRALIAMTTRLGPAAVPAIVEKMGHPKWYFVRNLCVILGDIGDRRAVSSLMRAASHADARVRREAILAVGKIGAPEAVPALGKILLEESLFSAGRDDQVRIDAASALYRIGGAEATSLLHSGTEVRRAAVRAHCEGLIRGLGKTP
ncbi:MAG: HEAT repeat domain-containing protein [Gemmatimonadota bacterium]